MMKILAVPGAPWMRAAMLLGVLSAGACDGLPTGPGPVDGPLAGIDVSHWQGAIDWNAVAGDGVEFAFIKATEGGDYTDPRFAQNWAGARQAGVVRGAYHFFRPQTDAMAQAAHFLSTVQLAPGDLPPVLDVEVTDGRSLDVVAAGVRVWLQEVERATGRRPIIYTRASFWTAQMGGGFGGYPLWVAHYGVNQPNIPGGWGEWTFWQYSDAGRVDGISGDVDLNWFNGGRAELETFAAGGKLSVVPR
jgi:lysozyme